MLIKIAKFFLYATTFAVVVVSTSTLFPFIVGKYTLFRAAVDLALIAFLFALVFDAEGERYWERLKKVLKSPLGIAVTIFTTVFLLAGFFGVNPSLSFWSNFERGEGGLQILHLYAFFLLFATLFTEKRQWIKVFWFSLVGALFMALYGVFAGLGSQNFLSSVIYGVFGIFSPGSSSFIGTQFGEPGFRLAGSIGNPAYVAGYLIFIFFYALYILKQQFKNGENKLSTKIVLIILLLIFAATFVLAATRGAFIGLIAGVLATLVYIGYSKKTWRKWLAIAALAMVMLISTLVYFQNSPLVKRIPGSRLFDLSAQAETFSTRRIIWSTAWHGFLARPLLGWGPENFLPVFDGYFNTAYFVPGQQFGAWFDRAHSILFDYLAETGILGAISYFGMFAVLLFEFFRRARKPNADVSAQNNHLPITDLSVFERAILFALPIAYLVQGLILFDVLPLYLNLFLLFAFAEYLFLPSHQTLTQHGTRH